MEMKVAEGAPQKAWEKEKATSVEGKYQLRQLKDVPAMLKSKTRAAGEYATLRTRQGISMFGEPKIDAIVEEGGMGNSMRWAHLKSKVRAVGEYATLRTRQGISMFSEPKIDSIVNEGGDRQG